MSGVWQCKNRSLKFDKPLIMGIVNVTPDSFYAGSRRPSVQQAVDQALQMLDDGAALLDIGGESTRPGAAVVSLEEEIARVVPVVTAIRAARPEAFISVDTRHTAVARAALEAGADIINDVDACSPDEGMQALIAQSGAGYVLMHSRGTPTTMDQMTDYKDVITEVTSALLRTRQMLRAVGVKDAQIVLDAGFGFAKTHADSLRLLGATAHFAVLGPYLIAASRKRFVGEVTHQAEAADRLAGSLGAALYAAEQGAAVIRVHDVRATADALSMYYAAKGAAHA